MDFGTPPLSAESPISSPHTLRRNCHRKATTRRLFLHAFSPGIGPVNLRRRFYLIRASELSLIDIRRFLSYDRVVNNDLLTSVVIFFVVLVVATVTAWRIPSGRRRTEGHRRDPLQNGSADGEHITD